MIMLLKSFRIHVLILAFVCSTRGTQVREYCSGESLNATCGRGVVVMTSAVYGRMRIGRCVTRDMGHLGCAVDALGIADLMCSGKQSCEIRVANTRMDAVSPCLNDLTPYLEASYICQPVITLAPEQCKSKVELTAGTFSRYLSSSMSSHTGCGHHNAPWIISAQTNQRIRITLHDYAWNRSRVHDKDCARRYGHVVDLGTDEMVRLCGSVQREVQVFTSQSNVVQIVFEKDDTRKHHFLVQYEALGCVDLVAPRDASLHRHGDKTTVTCDHAHQSWYLTCVNNQWQGVIGNCSQYAVPIEPHAISSLQQTVSTEAFVVFIVVASLVLSATIVFVGIVWIRRNTLKERQKYMGDDLYERRVYRPANGKSGDVNYDVSLYSRGQQKNSYMQVQTAADIDYQEPADREGTTQDVSNTHVTQKKLSQATMDKNILHQKPCFRGNIQPIPYEKDPFANMHNSNAQFISNNQNSNTNNKDIV